MLLSYIQLYSLTTFLLFPVFWVVLPVFSSSYFLLISNLSYYCMSGLPSLFLANILTIFLKCSSYLLSFRGFIKCLGFILLSLDNNCESDFKV